MMSGNRRHSIALLMVLECQRGGLARGKMHSGVADLDNTHIPRNQAGFKKNLLFVGPCGARAVKNDFFGDIVL